jgi:hypothetical protein
MLPRREREDRLLAAARAELEAYERKAGRRVVIDVDTAVAAGNCRDGAVEWLKTHSDGVSVLAHDALRTAQANRDQIPHVARSVRKAIARAKNGG